MAAAKIEVRDAHWGDALLLAPRLRNADYNEVCASYGTDIESALTDAVQRSAGLCWAVYRGGEILMLLGVAPVNMLSGTGSPWLLGSPAADRMPKTLHRVAKEMIAAGLALYPDLVNYVDARNTRSVRWLERLGFTLHPPEPYGPFGLPFHRFEMSA